MAFYERLSAMDASFLGIEDGNCHMHVGGVMIFDSAALRTSEGGIDIARIRQAIESRLHLVPRFRQRLEYIPYGRLPVWVDDDGFRLEYHVRHTALPRPGDERALKRVAGRIMSQPLDRRRPLWEMWVIEGLDGDRFALVNKTHHCMIDGVAGADLLSVIMSPHPEDQPAAPIPWRPRARPSSTELMVHEVIRRVAQPITAMQAVSDLLRDPEPQMRKVADAVAGVMEAVAPALNPVSSTPLNVEIGPHRRFDWLETRLTDVKAIKKALGGTLNDVVLATVSGALRTFLAKRGLAPDALDIRALVPVSVRLPDERGQLGNRVTQITAPLPVNLDDPVARLHTVHETTAGLKESRQTLGGEVLMAIGEWTVPHVLVQAVRFAARTRPYSLIVTNVPGPQIPLYLLGALMQTAYPVVPLFQNLALVVGLFSYNGSLYWGLNADWEQVPDLHEFSRAIEISFGELLDAAHTHVVRLPNRTRPARSPRSQTEQRAAS